ncbi:hypothetical protein AAE478_007853 [Parahypoxylon ruwenzoriense]
MAAIFQNLGGLWGRQPILWRSEDGDESSGALPEEDNKDRELSFEHVKPIALTRAQRVAMGKDPLLWLPRFNDEYWGLGDDA